MQVNSTHYIGAKECPYTLQGQKLTELRRARLRVVAGALGLSQEGSKNALLQRIIGRLKTVGADTEIGKQGESRE